MRKPAEHPVLRRSLFLLWGIFVMIERARHMHSISSAAVSWTVTPPRGRNASRRAAEHAGGHQAGKGGHRGGQRA